MLGADRTLKTKTEVSGVLTDREVLAITWVIEQGVMTADQIFRAVYDDGSGKTSRYAYRRIQFLEEAGYLESVSAFHKKEKFLKAKRQALKTLQLRGCMTRTLSTPTISEIPHAEVLTEIRIAILKSGKHGDAPWWRCESVLLDDEAFPAFRFQDLMPDALWITKSGKRVAIEFERTRKGITRVRKKVEGLDQELNRSDRAFDLVLWVSIDGAYRDLKNAIGNRETQTLRTIDEFLKELRGE